MYSTQRTATFHTCRLLARSGERVAPRGMPCRELLNSSMTIECPNHYGPLNGRDLNHVITAIEVLQLVGQQALPELTKLNKSLHRMTVATEDGVAHGSYGHRVYGQLEKVVDLLRRDPDSRQAVISIYDSRHDLVDPPPMDVPCTVALQFFIRRQRLEMRTVMRSNDAWLGLPYDLLQFTALQAAIAQALDMNVGPYHHSVGSMHLYERDMPKVEGLSLAPNRDWLSIEWSPGSIDEISSRCRRMAAGEGVARTLFEFMLQDALDGAR